MKTSPPPARAERPARTARKRKWTSSPARTRRKTRTRCSTAAQWADLEALLRDTLVEELPLQPLCKPDCKGLCSQCGIDLNENPDHQHDMTDIRFAALEGLKAKLEGKE